MIAARKLFKGTTAVDLFRLVVGERIGGGISREVYEFRPNNDLIIKFDTNSRSFQNVSEWETWGWVRGTRMARWFAPCVQISPCGTVLLQRRCEPLQKKQIPRKLPAFLCDFKPENFGLLEGKVVCLDYGTAWSCIRSVPKQLVKVDWR